MDNRKPYIYKTTDFGATWKKISGDLPSGHPLDYVLSVAENPNKKGMLFAGTGHAFYYSLDDGATWTQFKDGLPPAPVTWVVVEPRFHDVVVSTYGRGLFILHDITPLEQTGQYGTGTDTTDAGSRAGGDCSVRRAACSRRPGVRTSRLRCRSAGRRRPAGDPRRDRQTRSGRSSVIGAPGAEPR